VATGARLVFCFSSRSLSTIPVPKEVSHRYCRAMMKQSISPNELKVVTQSVMYDDVSSMLAVLGAIPDGLSLFNFPGHWEGTDCWCRPHVTVLGDSVIVSHKDLEKGEFDS